jgi:hypothetical protein
MALALASCSLVTTPVLMAPERWADQVRWVDLEVAAPVPADLVISSAVAAVVTG